MVGVAGVAVFLGYAVFAYGWSQVRGCNAGFIDMVAFWRPVPQCNPDSGNNVSTQPGSTGGTVLGSVPTHNAVPNSGPVITSSAQANRVLNNPQSTKAEKQAAADYLYTQAG